jgi:hypothetical protein
MQSPTKKQNSPSLKHLPVPEIFSPKSTNKRAELPFPNPALSDLTIQNDSALKRMPRPEDLVSITTHGDDSLEVFDNFEAVWSPRKRRGKSEVGRFVSS